MAGLMKKAALAAATLCFALSSQVLPIRAQTKEPMKLTFALDFIPLGRHAAWYAAIGAGYFREEGLDVTIIPTQGTAQALQSVESGLAQLGLADVPALVLARAGGSKIKMVTVNYQKSPYAIFSLSPGAAVTKPEQLEGLKLGSGAGSFTPKVIAGFMAQKGLDPSKLEIVNVAPPARANMLLTAQVPAIEFFVMSKPGLEAGAKSANAKLETFLLADNGLDLYSLGVAGTEDFLAKNPDVVKGFVRAALRGWKLALDDPEKAAAYEKQLVPTLKEDVIRQEIEVVRDLAVTPDTKTNGLGWFDPARFGKNLDFVVKYIGVTGTAPKAEDLYATGFLPEPAILP
jgi:NitT/TauT family transport system substrate-binding protein